MVSNGLIQLVARGAHALIDAPEKWGKGGYQPTPETRCLLRAVKDAIDSLYGGPRLPHRNEIFESFDLSIASMYPKYASHIGAPGAVCTHFNDDPETTHADVAVFLMGVGQPARLEEGELCLTR